MLQLQGEGDQLVPGLGNLKDDADQSWEVLVLVFMGEALQFNI